MIFLVKQLTKSVSLFVYQTEGDKTQQQDDVESSTSPPRAAALIPPPGVCQSAQETQ